MTEEKIKPYKYFLSGGVGGICIVLVGHPFDTIKVRMQTMPKAGPGQKPLYSGTLDCVKKTISKEGFRGLYKGIGAPLFVAIPILALRFCAFGIAKRFLHKTPDEELSKPKLFLSGAFAGTLTAIATVPGERVKCLLQIQRIETGPPKYSGIWDVVQKLYQKGGIRSLYKGSGATLLRDIPSTGAYMMTYDSLKKLFKPTKESSPQMGALRTMLAGGLAGMSYWCLGIPADVIKSRVQASGTGVYTRGVRDALPQLLGEEGVRSLFKGSAAVLARAFPANAACFLGFELFMKFLNLIDPDL